MAHYAVFNGSITVSSKVLGHLAAHSKHYDAQWHSQNSGYLGVTSCTTVLKRSAFSGL